MNINYIIIFILKNIINIYEMDWVWVGICRSYYRYMEVVILCVLFLYIFELLE